MKCLPINATCHWNGTLGYCCTTHCFQLEGQPFGDCQLKPTLAESTNSDSFNWSIFAAIVSVLVIITIFAGFTWLYRRQRRIEQILSKADTDLFFNGNINPDSMQMSYGYAHEIVEGLPYDNKWEIPESDYFIDTNKQLGSGCYGVVLLGKVKDQIVAIKTIRPGLLSQGQSDTLRSLMLEIKVLQYIGSFENVVSLIGCNTVNLISGKAYIFLEYCPLGSLEKFLRKNKHLYKAEDKADKSVAHHQYTNLYQNDLIGNEGHVDTGTINAKDLLLWSLQLANAVQFMASKKVIHADIATRNVLLLRKDCVKLTDFGLSRRLNDYSNYVKQHQEPLPWRWMALESLKELSFSYKSDVWALGIAIWEIYTLGQVPYPGLAWTPEFITLLSKNLRPTKPEIVSEEIYNIMVDCWKPEPGDRPTSEQVYNRIFVEFEKF